MTKTTTTINDAIIRINAGASWLRSTVEERDDVVRALILAATAGEHLFLFGPPGVGKSLALRNFRTLLGGASYFEVLMTRFTMPEEIWGPLSTEGLRRDCYRRNLSGRLAEVEIAFLDEIFKANSAILNALLTALNERVFHDDGQAKQIPLRTVVAASNEVPSDDSGLAALADRLALRLVVPMLREDDARDRVTWGGDSWTPPPVVTWGDFDAVRGAAFALDVSKEARAAMRAIVDDVRAAGIEVSDRRVRKAGNLARCAAALAASSEVTTASLDIVRHVFWNKPSEALVVGEIVDKHASVALVEVRRLNGVIADVERAVDAVTGDRVKRMMAVNTELQKLDEARDSIAAMRRIADPSIVDAVTALADAEQAARTKATKALAASAGVR